MKQLNVKHIGGAAKQAGFTIIELVVVILLLGILTATALPRFLDLSDEAHDGIVNAHFGALASGLSLYKAAWYANLQTTSATINPFDGGTALFASADGYPSRVLASGAGDDPTNDDDCAGIFNAIIDDTLSTGQNAGTAASGTAQATPGLGQAINNGDTDWITGNAADEWASVFVTSTSSCEWYYMGQFTAVGDLVPYISYHPDGTLTLNSEIALAAQ